MSGDHGGMRMNIQRPMASAQFGTAYAHQTVYNSSGQQNVYNASGSILNPAVIGQNGATINPCNSMIMMARDNADWSTDQEACTILCLQRPIITYLYIHIFLMIIITSKPRPKVEEIETGVEDKD